MNSLKVKRVQEVICDFPGLGDRIRKARESDSRSLTAICTEAGISRSYWYQLENGDMRSPATEEIIRKVERVLGVDLGVNFEEPIVS
jgi:transcriptional regulator with XRE-family HTH domain